MRCSPGSASGANSLSRIVFMSLSGRPGRALCGAESLKGNQPSRGPGALISKPARIPILL